MFKSRIETFARVQPQTSQEQAWYKFALTDTNLEEGTFKGVASVFGSIVNSWMPTIIEPGAFTKTLQEGAARVKLLWQHDVAEPIGVPTSLQENSQGLQLTGKISQTTRGKDALILMRDGVVDELSIGFDPIKWEMEDRGNGEVIRHIREVRLWEISAVTFAADPMAKIQAVHSLAFADEILAVPLYALLNGADIENKLKAAGVEITLAGLAALLMEVHAGKVLSSKNKKLLSDAIAALQALVATAEPPDDEEDKKSSEKEALTVNVERLNRLREAEICHAQSYQL